MREKWLLTSTCRTCKPRRSICGFAFRLMPSAARSWPIRPSVWDSRFALRGGIVSTVSREARGDFQQWVTGSGRIGACLRQQGGFKLMGIVQTPLVQILNCPGRGGRSSLARQHFHSDGGLHQIAFECRRGHCGGGVAPEHLRTHALHHQFSRQSRWGEGGRAS